VDGLFDFMLGFELIDFVELAARDLCSRRDAAPDCVRGTRGDGGVLRCLGSERFLVRVNTKDTWYLG
jgi:hypothetical protein